MKKSILITAVIILIQFPLISQNKVSANNAIITDQTNEWITKISSDSDLRGIMMSMMLAKTTDDNTEMKKLAKIIMSNPQMNNLINPKYSIKAANNNIEVKKRGIHTDTLKMKMDYNPDSMRRK